MRKTILVAGGTGMLGQPVSRCLKETGFQVRIMTRDREKASKIFDNSFEILAGDPTESGRVEEALHGCYGVHISLPTEAEQQVTEAIVTVAARHGLERITYVSGATVAEENRSFPMINRKFLAEKVIRESGVPYTIFCPTWVMESLPMFVNRGRAAVLGKQPYPYHWFAAEDLGRMVSTAYGLGEAANRRFFVHGPEAILLHDALRRYCAAFHPDIKEVSSMPFWLVKILATTTGDRGLRGAGEMMSYFERVGERGDPTEANRILGAPAMTLEMWLARRKGRT